MSDVTSYVPIYAAVVSGVIGLLGGICGGLIVTLVNHFMTRRREAHKLQADISLKYRVDAWRAIERTSGTDKNLEPLESAVADILLFGTDQEIGLLRTALATAGKKGVTDTTPLLTTLRKNIRGDLGLKTTSTEHLWFRADVSNDPYLKEQQNK